ncbi:MAG: BlaI/MecI/CopY family transcriptional regulator [Thermaerobacter sp.]|nr:BlaI/MecI/CopY family transcriptional regulator [Thermaerobacter sp.]
MVKWALRQKVLWIVRESGPCSASDVCTVLRKDREISLNAVQTVLNRLVQEGLLVRGGERRHYHYTALPGEDVVRERAAQAAVDLLSQSGDSGLAHFLDTIGTLDPKVIEQLERLLQERRQGRGEGEPTASS